MYNNSFWQFKKWLSEAKQKKMRGGSPSHQPPEEWTNVHGDTRRKEYLSARQGELQSVMKKATAAVTAAKQVPDHGIPDNIHDIISSGTSRQLEKHSYPLRSSKNPHLRALGDHLQEIAHRRSNNPPHPEAPEPDYQSRYDDMQAARRERASDPGLHFPFYPNQ